jgi:outer membrane protein assembly factor BamB
VSDDDPQAAPRLSLPESSLSDGFQFETGYLRPPEFPGAPIKLDHYELLEQIGEGAMGVVYRARAHGRAEPVAVKLLKYQFVGKPALERSFLKEARTLLDLTHPHIIQVLEVSERRAGPYFVMPLMERGSLARRIHESGPLEPSQIVKIVQQVGSALVYLHEKDYLHRDVSPGNILFDSSGHAILGDLGLNRDQADHGASDPRGDVRVGTAPYMPPEVAAGKGSGVARDIYALGAVLYEMLAGRPPYAAHEDGDLLHRILDGPPEPLPTFKSPLANGLARIAEGAMNPQAAGRYHSVADLVADVDRAEHGRKPLGPDGQRRRRLRILPWPARRRPVTLVRAGLVLACVLAAIAWFTWKRVFSNADRNAPAGLYLVRSVQRPEISTWSSALTGDWDGDGQPDLLLTQDGTLFVTSEEGEILLRRNLNAVDRAGIALSMVADLDRDGRVEAFVRFSEKRDMFIDVLTQGRYGVLRVRAEGEVYTDDAGEPHPSVLDARCLADLDGNGQPRLLASAGAGRQGKPRGVYCFDTQSGQLRWSVAVAGGVDGLVAGDIDGTGKTGIVFGTHASANGVSAADGTDDRQSYVYALNASGRVLWSRPIGAAFSHVFPILADVRGDGKPQIYLRLMADRQFYGRDLGTVLALNADGSTRASFDLEAEATGMDAVQLQPSAPQRLLVTDRRGRAHLLDANLRPVKQIQLLHCEPREARVQFHCAADLGHDGQKGLVFSTCESSLAGPQKVAGEGNARFYYNIDVLLLDAELQTIGRYRLADQWKVHPGIKIVPVPTPSHAQTSLLVLTDRLTRLAYRPPPKR